MALSSFVISMCHSQQSFSRLLGELEASAAEGFEGHQAQGQKERSMDAAYSR